MFWLTEKILLHHKQKYKQKYNGFINFWLTTRHFNETIPAVFLLHYQRSCYSEWTGGVHSCGELLPLRLSQSQSFLIFQFSALKPQEPQPQWCSPEPEKTLNFISNGTLRTVGLSPKKSQKHRSPGCQTLKLLPKSSFQISRFLCLCPSSWQKTGRWELEVSGAAAEAEASELGLSSLVLFQSNLNKLCDL